MTISAHLAAALSNPECYEILIQLLEITHSAWGYTFRICNDNADIVHGGNTYTSWPFTIPLISEAQGALPRPTLIIDNVLIAIAAAIKSVAGSKERISVTAKLVTKSHPDTIERGPTTFKVRRVRVNITQIACELTLLAVDLDQIPFVKIDPTHFPGAFGVIR